jgi:predicted ribosome quality control (RQC) complex YloA/Tae2 family protein
MVMEEKMPRKTNGKFSSFWVNFVKGLFGYRDKVFGLPEGEVVCQQVLNELVRRGFNKEDWEKILPLVSLTIRETCSVIGIQNTAMTEYNETKDLSDQKVKDITDKTNQVVGKINDKLLELKKQEEKLEQEANETEDVADAEIKVEGKKMVKAGQTVSVLNGQMPELPSSPFPEEG